MEGKAVGLYLSWTEIDKPSALFFIFLIESPYEWTDRYPTRVLVYAAICWIICVLSSFLSLENRSLETNCCHWTLDKLNGLFFSFLSLISCDQVLYVPRHWWHYVESIDPITVSVNSWIELVPAPRHVSPPSCVLHLKLSWNDALNSPSALRFLNWVPLESGKGRN